MEEINKELLLKVADVIEAYPENFNMRDFFNDCGTTACIAGWCVSLAYQMPIAAFPKSKLWVAGEARKLLGFKYECNANSLEEQAVINSLFFDVQWRNSEPKKVIKKPEHIKNEQTTPPNMCAGSSLIIKLYDRPNTGFRMVSKSL